VNPRGGTLFTGMFLAAALAPLGSTMIAVALPSISAELGVPGGALTHWLVSAYLIAGIAAMSPGGKLGDLIGQRRSLVIGMSIYAAGSLLGFLVATLPSLALARIAMAVGGAMMAPATLALLRNSVPAPRRPRVFGTFGAVMGTAAAIGPLVGGELTRHFGWRAVFVGNLPVILLAFTLIRLSGRAAADPVDPAARRAPFDVAGSALLAAALAALALASPRQGPRMWWYLAAGIALLAAFVWWERRVAAPVVDLRLFTRRAFVGGSVVVGLQNLAMYALLVQVPLFFEQVRGLPAGAIGRALLAMMVPMVVLAPVSGRLAERFGVRRMAVLGCAVSLAGVLALADFARLAAPGDALLGLALVGGGLGLATEPSQTAATSAVDLGGHGRRRALDVAVPGRRHRHLGARRAARAERRRGVAPRRGARLRGRAGGRDARGADAAEHTPIELQHNQACD
jgi:MFS family permease